MSEAIVLDTETTGSKQPMNVIELAYAELRATLEVERLFHSMYKPELPILLGAKSAHHILECDVVDACSFDTFELPSDVRYVIGHKVDFDMDAIGFSEDTEVKRICTLALARRHLPDLDSHTQSALIYHYYPEAVARDMIKNAHRADADVLNCLELLRCLQADITEKGIPFATFEEMYVESERSRIPDRITFGKHANSLVTELPTDYKQWILRQPDMDKYLKQAVRQSMQ